MNLPDLKSSLISDQLRLRDMDNYNESRSSDMYDLICRIWKTKWDIIMLESTKKIGIFTESS